MTCFASRICLIFLTSFCMSSLVPEHPFKRHFSAPLFLIKLWRLSIQLWTMLYISQSEPALPLRPTSTRSLFTAATRRASWSQSAHCYRRAVGLPSLCLFNQRSGRKNCSIPPLASTCVCINDQLHRFQELLYEGVNVDVIHADRPQGKRDEVVRNFRQGITWVLICTDLMGRGIDFKGVNLVINYDFPQSVISYIHRIGRTGRAGKNGEAITYFTQVINCACLLVCSAHNLTGGQAHASLNSKCHAGIWL